MINLEPFQPSDFDRFIAWIDSKEILVTIAGTVLTYPLTTDQLEKYLDDEKSISFNVVDTSTGKTIGHAELIPADDGSVKIDKLIIGDKTNRGKGIGQQVIEALLEYSFLKLRATIVELNVYDWNTAGIKCYEKCGFQPHREKKLFTNVGDISWEAFNMTIDKEQWQKQKEGNARKPSP